MSSTFSPIAQFRSKVQWYLDGNTPGSNSNLIAELLVALKILASELSNQDSITNCQALADFRNFAPPLSVRALQDSSKLRETVQQLANLLQAEELKMVERRTFRDAVVQLILVAESTPDLPFRRAVLELSKSIG